MQAIIYAKAALLRRRMDSDYAAVTEANRPLHLELTAAGLVELNSTMLKGAKEYQRPIEFACAFLGA